MTEIKMINMPWKLVTSRVDLGTRVNYISETGAETFTPPPLCMTN